MILVDVICTSCNLEAERMAEWHTMPPCSICGAETMRKWSVPASVIGDDIPGGQVIETISHEPQTFYSKKAIAAAADAAGLRHTDRFPSWRGVITEKRLRDVAELLSRGTKSEPAAVCETATFTVEKACW